MNKAPFVLDWIFDHQWAMTADSLDNMIKIASRESTVRDIIAAREGKPLEKTEIMTIRDNGVAVLDIVGPIFPRANLFTMFSGGTSIDILAKDFMSALENPTVRGIVLNIDSPGGNVIGISEFSKMIYDARGKKPIVSYGYGLVASGGYWIGTAASKLYGSDTTEFGSIGVVTVYSDRRERDKASGIRTYEIVSSVSPKKRPDPATDEGRDEIQRVVDDLANVFVETVAGHRKTTVKTVLDKFGQGGMLIGQKAVDAGMADGVSSLEKVIDTLLDSKKTYSFKGGSFMNLQELKANHPETYQAAVAEGVENGKKIGFADGKTQGIAEGKTAGLEEGKKIGVSEERARIQKIEALKVMPGAEAVIAENKFKDGMTAEAIASIAYNAVAQNSAAAAGATASDARDLGLQADKVATGAPANSAAEEDKFIAEAEKIGKAKREAAGRK
jgi:capsid assembly protease